ncbi:hypothetical protein UlMin_040507 [Ulmus minor]
MRLQKLFKRKTIVHVWINILLCSFLAKAALSAEQSSKACKPRNCGSGPNISLPFYSEGFGAASFGLGGFGVVSENNKPIYYTSRGPYIIKDISYENQYVQLVSLDVFDSTICFAPKHNFIFDNEPSPLSFNSSHANLQFFYRCNQSFTLSIENSSVPCASSATHPSFVVLINNDEDFVKTENCESHVEVPIDLEESNQTIKTVNYTELLTDGFRLVWNEETLHTGCASCIASGGQCGVQNGVISCLYPDGSNPTFCSGETAGNPGHLAVKAAIASTVAGLGVLLVTLCCLRKKLSNFFWRRHNKTHQNIEAFLRNYGPLQVRRYRYSDIKKMTNSFTEKLGQGGFGDVYKGKLDDGCLVAVKVLNNTKGSNAEEFINEVATISRTSHVNIVSLLGFCFASAKKRALIFEFMPNGSLEKFIFDENSSESNPHQLDWETHYQISLGIARGLEYLHRGCNTRILHFDIKPHNILLDAEFVPKISDFGLAKICTRKESIVSMMGPRGTIGYIAPEVFSRTFGDVSYKSDVYSYGMMVLDMVGGRENINVRVDNTSEIDFPQWIYKRLEIDEDLGMKRIRNEEERVKVRKMIIVGLWCIQTDPSTRPTMSKVIEMLDGSLDSLQVPPKPFLSSPPRSPPPDSSSTPGSEQI